MFLDPPQFSCPTHGHDLTPLVIEALDEMPLPSAMRPSRRRGEFEVLVTCPGTTRPDAEPEGQHQVPCEGVYRR